MEGVAFNVEGRKGGREEGRWREMITKDTKCKNSKSEKNKIQTRRTRKEKIQNPKNQKPKSKIQNPNEQSFKLQVKVASSKFDLKALNSEL
jgi:hypothetical protein